jgi:hypothetical protein
MKKFLKTWLLISILCPLASCSGSDDTIELPRNMPVEVLFNDIGDGTPGFYEVRSNFEYREIFNQDAPSFDFSTGMMLVFISEKRSSSESYDVGGLIEREPNIIYQINFYPCDVCTRDAVSKVLIVGTDRSNKPILLDLFTVD